MGDDQIILKGEATGHIGFFWGIERERERERKIKILLVVPHRRESTARVTLIIGFSLSIRLSWSILFLWPVLHLAICTSTSRPRKLQAYMRIKTLNKDIKNEV